MQKHILCLLTFVFTFIAGVTVPWIFLISLEAISLPSDLEAVASPFISEQRFSPRGRGCGNGYTQSYITNDEQFVSEGLEVFNSPRDARREFHKDIVDATLVRFTDWNNDERKGERRVLTGTITSSTTILFYEGTDHIRFITAPNESLAREFEGYLISHDNFVDLRPLSNTK